jgi:hypothetical protein
MILWRFFFSSVHESAWEANEGLDFSIIKNVFQLSDPKLFQTLSSSPLLGQNYQNNWSLKTKFNFLQ